MKNTNGLLMPYNKFAFFSYRCATAFNNDQGNLADFLPHPTDQSDIAQVIRANRTWLDNIQSVDGRIRVLKTLIIIDEARRWADDHYYGGPNVLKIFVAPEFYFRPHAEDSTAPGEKRYTEADGFSMLTSLLQTLSDPIFNHWVFIPGTLISTAQIATKYFTTNTGVIIEGGTTNHIGVIKHNTSEVDGVQKGYQGDEADNYSLFEYKAYLNEKTDLFLLVHNKTFGLEICRDHSVDLAVLKHAVVNNKDRVENRAIAQGLDFHILVSLGSHLNPTGVAARQNGYIFQFDGKYSEIFPENALKLKRVERQVFDDVDWFNEIKREGDFQESLYGTKSSKLDPFRGRSRSTGISGTEEDRLSMFSDESIKNPFDYGRRYGTQLSDDKETRRFIIALNDNLQILRRTPTHQERIDISPMHPF
jgi:hypothetical protein